ncbi:alpha- and gamma-adaptin-binding protein p34-like [Macrosteles quadrilineatus]|uniref:alpha- and gamma-adaptin-binding protein p34-like n=1 Tax=Macrosteles quadrilineatus TaxID=74068 RepID=UPI0023E322EC|nr:alpha- and gamma-adaptin-binding protein p34-like [Macrosteles quadrilineatus]
MEPIPGILVVSCDSNTEPSIIAKKIFDKEGLPFNAQTTEGIDSYPWHISTKYYETDVTLYTLPTKMLLPQSLADGVQAVIIYFDSLQKNGLEVVESWNSFLKDYEVDISILLCNRCNDCGVSKLSALEWCVQHGFELVELDPEVDEEWEAEQDFVETTGIKRVVQALHAHVWPNLTLKDRKEPTSMSALLHGGQASGEIIGDSLILDTLPAELAEGNIEDRLDELLGCESETDFYQLFGELQTMKERMSALPNDQRKACAEQVVLAFWRAIGGEAEEVEPDLPTT